MELLGSGPSCFPTLDSEVQWLLLASCNAQSWAFHSEVSAGRHRQQPHIYRTLAGWVTVGGSGPYAAGTTRVPPSASSLCGGWECGLSSLPITLSEGVKMTRDLWLRPSLKHSPQSSFWLKVGAQYKHFSQREAEQDSYVVQAEPWSSRPASRALRLQECMARLVRAALAEPHP